MSTMQKTERTQAIEFRPEAAAEICQTYGVRFPGMP
jgi:hypothetical protein